MLGHQVMTARSQQADGIPGFLDTNGAARHHGNTRQTEGIAVFGCDTDADNICPQRPTGVLPAAVDHEATGNHFSRLRREDTAGKDQVRAIGVHLGNALEGNAAR